MPSLIPEPHATYARQIDKMIAREGLSLRDQISKDAGLSSAYATRLVEDPSIVCVAGERGSGKTTVLATAAAALSKAGHVVIPPVRPEYFPPSGSLIPMAVAHLQTTVRSDWLDQDSGIDPDTSLRLFRAVDRTLRQANLFSYGNPTSSSLRADEQAADRSLAASADSDFLDNWQQLTAEVRTMAGKRQRAKTPLIVLPVDDPDLTPGALSQILRDLRLLTSVDGVVGIACLDLAEVESVLSDAYVGSYHSPPDRLLAARVVQAQIAKAFPDDRLVTIHGLDSEQKLSFRALDLPLPTIEELCNAHSMPKPFEADTLASVLRMPDGSPSFYNTALPANPRDLRALAYRLSRADPDSTKNGSWAALELCRSAVNNGLKQSGLTEDSLWPSGPPFAVLPSTDGAPSCVLRFDDISVTRVKGGEHFLPGGKDDDDSTTVAVTRFTGIDAEQVKRGEQPQTIQRLDPSFAYAILLIREFSHYYQAMQCSISGPVPYLGSDRRAQYLKVEIDGTETDHRFLTPPAWEAFYDSFLLDHALSELMRVACQQHEFSDRRFAVEAYFLDFCHNVVSIQLTRTPARNPARVSQAIRERPGEKARQFLDRDLIKLFKEIGRCIEAGDEREREDDVRVIDFRRWVETGLVNVCHDRLLRPAFIDKLLDRRMELLGRRHRAAVANDAASDLLERRVKSALDETWVEPLIDVVRRFDEERGAILYASHAAALESVKRGRQRLLGETALGEASDEKEGRQTQDQANDFDIAIAVLDHLEAEAQTSSQQSTV